MLRTEKIKKSWLKTGPDLLEGAKAVVGRQSFPSFVYMNPKDYKILYRNVYNHFKAEYPFLNARKLASSTGMHLLNYGPVESKGIAQGYLMIDDEKIKQEAIVVEWDKP